MGWQYGHCSQRFRKEVRGTEHCMSKTVRLEEWMVGVDVDGRISETVNNNNVFRGIMSGAQWSRRSILMWWQHRIVIRVIWESFTSLQYPFSS